MNNDQKQKHFLEKHSENESQGGINMQVGGCARFALNSNNKNNKTITNLLMFYLLVYYFVI